MVKNSISNGKIKHIKMMKQEVSFPSMTGKFSNITILIGTEKFHLHRVYLGSQSNFFNVLLQRGFQESKSRQIRLHDIDPKSFRAVLDFMYAGFINLNNKEVDDVLDILLTTNKLCISNLETLLLNHLKRIIRVDSVCQILNVVEYLHSNQLKEICNKFIDYRASKMIVHNHFSHLSYYALKQLLERDTFCADEVHIFQAVNKWLETNANVNKDEILAGVRFILISDDDLLNVVAPTGLLSTERIQEIIELRESIRLHKPLPYRGHIHEQINIFQSSYEPLVIQGRDPDSILSNNKLIARGCSEIKQFTWHSIPSDENNNIIIKLNGRYLLNNFEMKIWNRNEEYQERHKYYIEVSPDGQFWTRVVDHTKYSCYGYQYVTFKSTIIQYIKIVGTDRRHKCFRIICFKCFHKKNSNDVRDGITVPKSKVEYVELIGSHNSMQMILNDYSENFGSQSRLMSENCINVALNQPFLVKSMQFYLEGKKTAMFSYYIEVSTDRSAWKRVACKEAVNSKTWQVIHFDEDLIVIFIRIVCTDSEQDSDFGISNFECPVPNLPGPV